LTTRRYCFNSPGQVLIHRNVSITLHIQRVAWMVYIIVYHLGFQCTACKLFNCSICLRLERYIDKKNIIQGIEAPSN
jgi:hypothetical protein